MNTFWQATIVMYSLWESVSWHKVQFHFLSLSNLKYKVYLKHHLEKEDNIITWDRFYQELLNGMVLQKFQGTELDSIFTKYWKTAQI